MRDGGQMLIRDPCKKCVVRACCTQACGDKIEREGTIEILLHDINTVKNGISNLFLWIIDNWVDILYSLIILAGLIKLIFFD